MKSQSKTDIIGVQGWQLDLQFQSAFEKKNYYTHKDDVESEMNNFFSSGNK